MKLTLEQLEDIKRNAVDVLINVKPTKWWSLDDLARGKMFSGKMIKKILKHVDNRRKEHRYGGWGGWTPDKARRHETSVPIELYLQPEFQKKYFPEADDKDKIKALELLKRDYPNLKAHD